MKTLFALLFCLLPLFITAQNDDWHISTQQNTDYTGIVVANGRIGILPSENVFKTKQIILNNVYEKASPQGVSQILLGINFQNLSLEIDGEQLTDEIISNWSQTYFRLIIKKFINYD